MPRDPAALTRPSVSAGARAAAILALLSGLGLLVALAFVVTGRGHYLVVVAAGLALCSGGVWWIVSRKGWVRSVGLLLMATGFGLAVGAMIHAASEPNSLFVEVGIVLALIASTFGLARLAMHRRPDVDASSRSRRDPPRHPVLICNPWSGGGKVEKFGLVELAGDLGVETILLDHGLDLEQLARDAIARGADCLGMAGGDGSQAVVASIAVEHDLPFVCVSAGTRNHFALDLEIDRDDPRKCLRAFTDAIERRIDYATVNGRFFVNNVSLGIYATIVQRDEYRNAKVETTTTLLPELLGRTNQPFDLQFTEPDGKVVDGAYLIQVSNNPYVLGASLDVSQRRKMDSGSLGVLAVTGMTGSDAAAIVTLSAIGQRKLSPNWHEFSTTKFEVRSRSGKAFAGVDGEAMELDTPMMFAIQSRGLRLLVPDGNLERADRRRSRQVTIRDVISVARGVDPVARAGSLY